MHAILQDIRQALRLLLKNPGFTLVSFVALASGIGLVSTQFSFIKGTMLTELPFEESERIIHLRRMSLQGQDPRPTPVRDYLAWKEQQTSFEDLAAYSPRVVNVFAEGYTPQRYRCATLSANLLPTLRTQPVLGRGFVEADELPGAPSVVLLGHRVWQRDFGGRPEVIGQTVELDGKSATIVGITPEGFRFPLHQEIWTNLRLDEFQKAMGQHARVTVIGRLKAGVSLADARSEFNVIASRLAEAWPENRDYSRVNAISYARSFMDEDTVPVMMSMLAMVLGVLLIACANVATLMLAQATRRTREMAIRAALGANRIRLIARTLAETMLLALGGGLGGLLLASWGTRLLNSATTGRNTPFWWDMSLDTRVVLATAIITVLAGLLCGLFPAWQASRANVLEALKDESASAGGLRLGRFSRSLVYVQVVLSGTLLVMTVLMAKSVVNGQRIRLPFSTKNMLIARLDLTGPRFRTVENRIEFCGRLLESLQVAPGVRSAAITSRDPLGMGFWRPLEIAGQTVEKSTETHAAIQEVVSADYFQTMGVSLIQGRIFNATDTVKSPEVALVNESLARVHWPDELPLGKRLRVLNTTNWITVVGVVPDLPMRGLTQPGDSSGFYLPQTQNGWTSLAVLLRVRGEPRSQEAALQRAIWDLAPNQPVHTIRTLEASLADQWAGAKFFAKIFTIFGMLAVFLAMLGVYGVMSFAVGMRTREFGLRFALGAQPTEVRWLVLAQGARYLAIGLPLAFLLAFGLSHPFQVIATNVSPLDPGVYVLVAAALSVAVLLASWPPARRAARVSPAVALRNE